MERAIFLDRDGTLINEVYNPITLQYESAKVPEDIIFCDYAIEFLQTIQKSGYLLFLISNQPDYAKCKNSLEGLETVHNEFKDILDYYGITFKHFYYCYHHPAGIIATHSIKCACRKPEPYFILKAANDYNIDLKKSWMIGDRDIDIICGVRADVKTIQITKEFGLKNALNKIMEDN